MRFQKTPSILLAGTAIAALGSGCAVAATPNADATANHVTTPATTKTTSATTAARTTSTRKLSRIDRLTNEAKKRYREETSGSVVHHEVQRIAADRGLIAALKSGNQAKLKRYVTSEFNSVWYHQHASRLRIVRGSHTLVNVGVPFVVAPAQHTIRDSKGHKLGTAQVSIQDVIGYVRYMHRNFPVDVVVRGKGAAHVRSSLPAATRMKLPSRGTATVGGRRMAVRSFHEKALGNEPVTVWILAKA